MRTVAALAASGGGKADHQSPQLGLPQPLRDQPLQDTPRAAECIVGKAAPLLQIVTDAFAGDHLHEFLAMGVR